MYYGSNSCSGALVKKSKGDNSNFETEGLIIEDIEDCLYYYIIVIIIVHNVESIAN